MVAATWTSIKRVVLDYAQFAKSFTDNSDTNLQHTHQRNRQKTKVRNKERSKSHQDAGSSRKQSPPLSSSPSSPPPSKATDLCPSTSSTATSTATYSKSLFDSTPTSTSTTTKALEQNLHDLFHLPFFSRETPAVATEKQDMMRRHHHARPRKTVSGEYRPHDNFRYQRQPSPPGNQLTERISPHIENITAKPQRHWQPPQDHRPHRRHLPMEERQPRGIPREIIVSRDDNETEEFIERRDRFHERPLPKYLNHEGIPYMVTISSSSSSSSSDDASDNVTAISAVSLPKELRTHNERSDDDSIANSDDASSIDWPSDEDGPGIFPCSTFKFWSGEPAKKKKDVSATRKQHCDYVLRHHGVKLRTSPMHRLTWPTN